MTILVIIFICSIAYCYLIAKLQNTAEQRHKIMFAIDIYVTEFDDCEKGLHLLLNMETYVGTWSRLWDWGYTRILPEEDFELIKPYIKSHKGVI